ncbi:MAG: DNA-binding protein [Caulobacterales bacterium 68-7]|nr:MAG: DNA-binding protein [Caulobacterales bacterium 68-7]
MTIDLRAHLRRIKPDKHLRQLAPRRPDDLLAAADFIVGGRAAMVVDTNVYIHAAAGTLPAAVKLLVVQGLLFHCSVCVGELSTGIANADPAHEGWKALRDYYTGVIANIPATRLLTPDPDVWAEAGLIAGTLARAQNWQRHQRKEALNDALIFLTAAKEGLPVLTANRDEFDLIQQLAPHGQFIYY